MSRRPPHLDLRGWALYVLRRCAQGLFVLWAAFTAAFAVLYLLPSDPARIMLSGSGAEFATSSGAELAKARAELGLDRPVVVQYLDTLWNAAHGDLGQSIQRGMPVGDLLRQAAGSTLQLALLAFAIALVAGMAVGVGSALVRRRWLRQVLLALPPMAVAMPSFWTGLLLTQVFAFRLGWVNIFDQGSLAALLLPAVTLAVPTSAYIAQVLSKSLAQTMRDPYVEVVRSRGASEARVVLRGALRNASLPLLTMIGMVVGNMFAGSVVVETVFSRMGVGRVTYEAVNAQDIPVVMGVVLLAAAVFVVVNLVVDIVYPVLDPRVVVRSSRTPARTLPVGGGAGADALGSRDAALVGPAGSRTEGRPLAEEVAA